MSIRRRDLLLMPAAAAWPHGLVTPGPVRSLVLRGGDPLAQLASRWRFGAPRRVVVRPHPAWWGGGGAVPDRWEAWLDLGGGSAVHVRASGVSQPAEAASRPWRTEGEAVAEAVRRLLTAEWDAGA